MARKSRKEGNRKTCKEPMVDCYYKACFYLRLSDKDIKEGNSESIENQRNLLEEFIKNKSDIRWVSTFIDDGKTGTNFKRSGFEQMMEAVKKGLINCIIVKDLSRFGRNYLETGNYIEHVFPFLQVRFIAVTDEFDTLTASQSQQAYLVPLKNIMNENYARDISQKERSAKKMLRKSGCFLGAYAMYGYQKAEQKHTLVIDPDAAIHVKEIFDLCEQGYSDAAIAKYLNKNQAACPSKYKYEKGILKHEKYANTAGWYPQTVAGILSSRIYIGDMVQGKRICKEIKGKKEVVPKESWDIVEGTHEPIISKEQFARVEAIRSKRHKKYLAMKEGSGRNTGGSTDENLLKGKLYCGDCKKAMMRIHVKSCKDEYRYVCGVYEKNGSCYRKFLPELELYDTLSCLIRKRVETACDLKIWLNKRNQGKNSQLYCMEQKLEELEQQINSLMAKRALLYKDWKEGILDEDEYLYIREHCEQDISRYKTEYEGLNRKKQEYIITYTDSNPALQATAGLEEEFQLTQELVHKFIERVDIYRDGRIRVRFCFQDEFDKLWDFCEQKCESAETEAV